MRWRWVGGSRKNGSINTGDKSKSTVKCDFATGEFFGARKENAPKGWGASKQIFCRSLAYFFFAFFAGFLTFFAIDDSPLINDCSMMHRVLFAR
jgi:hypothetical protein